MKEFLLYSQLSALLYKIAGLLVPLKKTEPDESYVKFLTTNCSMERCFDEWLPVLLVSSTSMRLLMYMHKLAGDAIHILANCFYAIPLTDSCSR